MKSTEPQPGFVVELTGGRVALWSLFENPLVPFSSLLPSCFFSDLLCILADYQSAAVSPSASFPETSRSCADARQHWEEAAFPGFRETQRNCEEVEGPEGVPVKGDGCVRDKGKCKRLAYNPMTCITHRCYRRRFIWGGGKKKGGGMQLRCAREEE